MLAGSIILAVASYCNPMSIPDMPIGMCCRDQANSEKSSGGLWYRDTVEQYRELADPTLIVDGGEYWLFPSCGAAWKSTDGAKWTHVPVELPGIGYAPTVVKHEGKFYATSSSAPLLVADALTGPWKAMGDIELPAGSPPLADPMLFSDGGVLYMYWGCTPKRGIWGGVLELADTIKVVDGRELVPAEPDKHPWMRQTYDPKVAWMEGAWMIKIGNCYALTYSASGTENASYAMGVAYGDSPLGEFKVDENNPFFKKTTGLVTGTGHGSIVKGPDGAYYVVYCIAVGARHGFERFIGFDRLNVDEKAGKILGTVPTEVPAGMSVLGNYGGFNLKSCEIGKDFVVNMPESKSVKAFRVIWREVGLDTLRGVMPGPIQYRVWGQSPNGNWQTVYDASKNDVDLLVDYRELPKSVCCQSVKLEVIGAPKDITPALVDFTIFGD